MRLFLYKMIMGVNLIVFVVFVDSVLALTYSFTDKKVPCLTECKIWSGHKDYCWTGWSEWDYCSPGIDIAPQYYTALKKGDKYECQSLCGSFGYSYNWCWTDVLNSNWDYCSKVSGESSDVGYSCFSPCQKSNGRYYYSCFAVSDQKDYKKDAYCSPPPYDVQFFESVESSLINSRGKCKFTYSSQASRIVKRQKEWQIRKIGVDNLVIRYERRFQTLYPLWDAQTQAVVSYVIRPAPPEPGQPDVNLTMAVRAVITPQHVSYVQQNGRENIPERIEGRMTALNRLPGDERGHLLAASLGGPTSEFNFAPQSQALNRRVNSDNFWYTMEGSLRTFLSTNPGSRIEWTLVVGYNLSESRRPTLFGLNIRQYDHNGNLVCDSNDCIFTNDPRGGGPII